MKNILNKIGAVSKPVLFGAALGVATVAIGVGIATNFMSDGPKGVSGRVLGQYSSDTAAVGTGGGYDAYSKESLERQMAAAQAERERGTALDYLGEAGKNQFSYSEKANAYQGGVVDPMAMDTPAYEPEQAPAAPAGMSPEMAQTMNQFDNLASAALKNKAESNGDAAKAGASATQINKLNRSNGKGSFSGGSASSGGSRNIGGVMGAVSSDRPASQPIASANVGDMPKGNIAGVESAKHGRLGAMGGNNSRAGTSGSGGSGQAYFNSSVEELVSAQRYSSLAKGTVYSDAEKGFVQAGAAFDGSGEAESGVQIDGNTPMIQQAAALEREANTISGKNNSGSFKDLDTNVTAYSNAKKQLLWAAITMIAATAAVAWALMSIPEGPWAPMIKGIILGAGIMGIACIYGFWMQNQIGILKNMTDRIPNAVGPWKWLAPALSLACSAALGVAYFSKQIAAQLEKWAIKLKKGGWFSSMIGSFIGNFGSSLAGGGGEAASATTGGSGDSGSGGSGDSGSGS